MAKTKKSEKVSYLRLEVEGYIVATPNEVKVIKEKLDEVFGKYQICRKDIVLCLDEASEYLPAERVWIKDTSHGATAYVYRVGMRFAWIERDVNNKQYSGYIYNDYLAFEDGEANGGEYSGFDSLPAAQSFAEKLLSGK